MSKNITVIIGAGPAGLTAAYELQKLGKKSIILEADRQVGGISKTVKRKGNRFDIGGHRFFSKVPYVNQVWDEILEDEFLTCQRLSRILYNKHFFDYPLKPLNALSGLGIQKSINVVLSYAKTKMFPWENKPDANFEQWIINRFGYQLYDIFFKTYTEKVWGIPCTEISADWARQRIKDFSFMEAIKNAFSNSSKNQKGEIITTLIEQFKYPRLGPGMMWEHCQGLLDRNNNPTLLETRVNKIKLDGKRVIEVTAVNTAGNQISFSGDQFISSMPLRELILSLDPLPPNKVVEAAKKLKYRDYFTVVLTIDRPDVFPDNWIYIHTPEVKLGRIQNYKNWSIDMVANQAYTTLGLEYFLWEKDPEWNWPNQDLVDLGIKECIEIGLIQRKEVLDGTIVRMKKAYPVYNLNYTANLKVIIDYLATIENLQTIGRNGLHRYNNQDHSMMTGIYAARNVLGTTHNVWSVNTEQGYHEEGNHSTAKSANVVGGRMVPIPVK